DVREGEYTRTLPSGGELTLVYVPPGSFRMGRDDAGSDERPTRRVTLSRGFFLGKFEVTTGPFAAYLAPIGREGPQGLTSVPPASFRMGRDDAGSDERPTRRVTLSRGFFLGKFEVTKGQFAAYLAQIGRVAPTSLNSFAPQSDEHPVGSVDWLSAHAFCAWA